MLLPVNRQSGINNLCIIRSPAIKLAQSICFPCNQCGWVSRHLLLTDVATNVHEGGSHYVVVSLRQPHSKPNCKFGSHPSEKAAVFRVALLTSVESGKGLKRCPRHFLPPFFLISRPRLTGPLMKHVENENDHIGCLECTYSSSRSHRRQSTSAQNRFGC